jgi:hypothetical protein
VAGWPPINLFAASEFATSSKLNSIWTAIQYEQQRPCWKLRQTSASQTIATGAWTAVTFNFEDEDTENGHSTVSNTSRYTCQTAGLYLVQFAAVYAGISTASGHGAGFRVDGAGNNIQYPVEFPTQTGGVPSGAGASGLVRMAVGSYIEAMAWQNSGANRSLTSAISNGTGDPVFSGVLVAQ